MPRMQTRITLSGINAKGSTCEVSMEIEGGLTMERVFEVAHAGSPEAIIAAAGSEDCDLVRYAINLLNAEVLLHANECHGTTATSVTREVAVGDPHPLNSGLQLRWVAPTWTSEVADPMDVQYDGVALRVLLLKDAVMRADLATLPNPKPFTPAQRAAVSAHWSAQLRAKTGK